ncbi:MAG: hypothetical protein AB7R89_17845 [Dehalococcoidia bacterium]
MQTAEATLAALCETTDLLVRAALLSAGYHQHHRGEWRRRRSKLEIAVEVSLPRDEAIDPKVFRKPMERAQRRYLAAIRTLAQVRRLLVPNVQVNIAENQINVAS